MRSALALVLLLASFPAHATASYPVPLILPGGGVGEITIQDPHPELGDRVIVCALADQYVKCLVERKDGTKQFIAIPLKPKGNGA